MIRKISQCIKKYHNGDDTYINMYEINKSFDIVNILTAKYDEKFKDYLTVKIFEDYYQKYMNILFKFKVKYNIIHTPISSFPEPWTYNCSRGGWGESAIQCYYDEEEIKYVKKNFIETYSDACQKRFVAFEQSKEKIKLILENFKKNKILELEKGFSSLELIKKNILNNDQLVHDNCFVQ